MATTPEQHRYLKSVRDIRLALVREFNGGTDVGEVLVAAVVAAQEQLDRQGEFKRLTDNRPGSWEAALLENILTSGGV